MTTNRALLFTTLFSISFFGSSTSMQDPARKMLSYKLHVNITTGADLDKADEHGCRLLEYALLQDNPVYAQILIANGARHDFFLAGALNFGVQETTLAFVERKCVENPRNAQWAELKTLMKAPAQTGPFMQLPQELKIKIMLHVARGNASQVKSMTEAVVAITKMGRLARACKGLNALLMYNFDFDRQFIDLCPEAQDQMRMALTFGTPAAKVILDNLLGKYQDSFVHSDFLKQGFVDANSEWSAMQGYQDYYLSSLYKTDARALKHVISKIVQWGLDVNTKTLSAENKNRALVEATTNLHREHVRFLLDLGAKTDVQTDDGTTALMGAVIGFIDIDKIGDNCFKPSLTDFIDIVQMLIDAGADINTGNNLGKTALYYALSNDKPSLARFLIEKGAHFVGVPNAIYETGIKPEAPIEFVSRKISEALMLDQKKQWAELKKLMKSKISTNT